MHACYALNRPCQQEPQSYHTKNYKKEKNKKSKGCLLLTSLAGSGLYVISFEDLKKNHGILFLLQLPNRPDSLTEGAPDG